MLNVVISCKFKHKFYFAVVVQDECSFVSLRDVDRTLQVMMWFYHHDELFELMDRKADDEANTDVDEDELAPPQVVP